MSKASGKKPSNDNPAQNIKWDLSEYYSGINDPAILNDVEKAESTAKEFTRKYKGKLRDENITSKMLLQIFEEYTEFQKIVFKYSQFSGLLSSKNTLDENISAFYQEVNERNSKIYADLNWFQLERKEWSEKKAREMINSPVLSQYKHFLSHERVFIPHVLSETEERILDIFSPVGPGAMIDLYDKTDSALKFDVNVEGEIKSVTYSELPKYLSYHPKREVRKSAAEGVTKVLQANTLLLTHILNTLLLGSKIDREVRGYAYPQEGTFKEYEVRKETVEKMTTAVENSYKISERYYKSKAKVLGYSSLYEWDRYCAIYPKHIQTVTWEETKEIILKSFREFNEEFARIAGEFFDKKWIDAEINYGKTTGAFCNPGIPTDHPFILVNFTGELNSVLTLAHELGHGIHAYLSRGQSHFEFSSSTVVAEIASVFAESLVFDYLYKDLKDKKVKLNLLAEKIQGSFATVFRQNAFYLFETDIHKHRKEKGELKTEEISSYYQKRVQATFGDSLKLTKGHRYWWMPISHFYHYNFYVFTYAFGELLTAALYAKYKMEGKKFVSKYLEALSMGGSKNPYEITKAMGVDINEENFWKDGLKFLDRYVDEFEKLVS